MRNITPESKKIFDLLKSQPEKQWDTDEIYARVKVHKTSISQRLRVLQKYGYVKCVGQFKKNGNLANIWMVDDVHGDENMTSPRERVLCAIKEYDRPVLVADLAGKVRDMNRQKILYYLYELEKEGIIHKVDESTRYKGARWSNKPRKTLTVGIKPHLLFPKPNLNIGRIVEYVR